MNRKQTILAVLVTALFVLAIGATWVVAGDDNVEYFACVNNSSGTIQMVGPEDTCNYNEQLVRWNQEGPAGPPGQSWYDAQVTYRYHGFWARPGSSGYTITCLSGETLLSAGYQFPYTSVTPRYSFPWYNTWYLGIDNPYSSNIWVSVYSACAKLGSLTTMAVEESGENSLIVTEITEEELPLQLPVPAQ
jgi:hypothetical protein